MTAVLTCLKHVYSTGLLIFSIVIIMALIYHEDTRVSRDVHPALAYILIWFAIFWMNMVEGSQGAFVGLPPVQRELYENTHPISHKCTSLCHKGDNLDR